MNPDHSTSRKLEEFMNETIAKMKNSASAKGIKNPKALNRTGRLKVAKAWAESLETNNKIKSYMKFFGVDKCCAAKELLQLGIRLEHKFAERWATRTERKARAKKVKKKALTNKLQKSDDIIGLDLESDHYHYFIAGYTPGGFSYGITWEQTEEMGLTDLVRK